jgi:trehalose synthase
MTFYTAAEGRRRMSEVAPVIERSTLGLHTLEQYEPLIGAAATERISRKADRIRTERVVHVSSTFYGGGVSEILTPLTLMMNAIGIETGWSIIQGTTDFFSCTKKLHNALQGQSVEFSDIEKCVYEEVVRENALRLALDDCDAVIVHDPQPLPLIRSFADHDMPWLWQCHIDLSSPDRATWDYVRGFVEDYDRAIFSLPEYGQGLGVERRF